MPKTSLNHSDQITTLTSDLIPEIIDWLSHYVPHQGTLQHFVHHNPLEAFESYPFEQACQIAHEVYRGYTFLEPGRYLDYLKDGRISRSALGDQLAIHLRARALESLLKPGDTGRLLDLLYQPPRLSVRHNILKKLSQDPEQALIQSLRAQIQAADFDFRGTDNAFDFPTHRDLILAQRGMDIDTLINPLMAKLLASFADPGSAYWKNEYKYQGLWACFVENHRSAFILENQLARKIHLELKKPELQQCDCDAVIVHYLQALAIPPKHWKTYLLALALRLRGWAGFFNQLEHQPFQALDQTSYQLREFIAVKLVYEYVTCQDYLEQFTPWQLRDYAAARTEQYQQEAEAELLYLTLHYLRLHQLTTQGVCTLSRPEQENLVQLLRHLMRRERQLIYQNALEKTYAYQCLEAFFQVNHEPEALPEKVSFHYITCIDDREESLRRYLEQIDPHCLTYGIAGHFEMNMEYKGFNEVRFRKLCPGVIQETFKVYQQDPEEGKVVLSQRYAWLFQKYALHSKISFVAYLLTLLTGWLSALPFFLKVFFPGLDLTLRRGLRQKFLHQKKLIDVIFHAQGNPEGISWEQGADKVWQLLRTVDLTEQLTEFIYVVGHGSSSINNPHEYAYNCGACGGGKGRANGRIFTTIANHPEVRRILAQKYQLLIPEQTIFIGGYHDTCKDNIFWFDHFLTPEQRVRHRKNVAKIEQALILNAAERARKFYNVPLHLSPEQAFRRVSLRSNDLTEARPEYNHATNALCIIGSRSFTRRLFLDRRSFLCSYNPARDDGAILARIMGAAIPVCAGINLEYFFSTMDPEVFGCGSKLNHNIVNNYAVMSGFASDLRLGLSRQMVEIHDPKRILILIDSKTDIILNILKQNAQLQRLVSNQWVHLMVHDFESKEFYQYQHNRFIHLREIAAHLKIYAHSGQVEIDAQNLIPVAVLDGSYE